MSKGVHVGIIHSLAAVFILVEKHASAKHFDSKADAEEYICTLDIRSMLFMPGLVHAKPSHCDEANKGWWGTESKRKWFC